jgi:hypothetical protein
VADGEKKSSSATGKIIATVFGAVIAPILVAVAVKWGDPNLWRATSPAAPGPAPTTAGGGGPPPPPPVLHLVTPKLGEHFYSYGWSKEAMADVRNDNVDPALFQYVSTPPSIAAASEGKTGVLETKNEYENYTLHVDYRWGEKTWGERETKARIANIFLHATGPDGVFGFYPQSVLVSLMEGSTGNIRLQGAQGKITGRARVKESPDKRRREYVGGNGPLLPQASGEPGWNGLILRLGFPEPKDVKDFKGWHPPGDPAIADLKPNQWNKVMIESHKGAIKVFVNNKLVNEIAGLNLKKGRIGFTSHQADYSIGRIELVGRP